jgi:hypothetical protein
VGQFVVVTAVMTGRVMIAETVIAGFESVIEVGAVSPQVMMFAEARQSQEKLTSKDRPSENGRNQKQSFHDTEPGT